MLLALLNPQGPRHDRSQTIPHPCQILLPLSCAQKFFKIFNPALRFLSGWIGLHKRLSSATALQTSFHRSVSARTASLFFGIAQNSCAQNNNRIYLECLQENALLAILIEFQPICGTSVSISESNSLLPQNPNPLNIWIFFASFQTISAGPSICQDMACL